MIVHGSASDPYHFDIDPDDDIDEKIRTYNWKLYLLKNISTLKFNYFVISEPYFFQELNKESEIRKKL